MAYKNMKKQKAHVRKLHNTFEWRNKNTKELVKANIAEQVGMKPTLIKRLFSWLG